MTKKIVFVLLIAISAINCKKNKEQEIVKDNKDTTNLYNPDDTLSQPIDSTDTIDTIPIDTVPEYTITKRIFLYVSLDSDKKIAVYEIDTLTGSIQFVEFENTAGNVGSLAHNKTRHFLYAAIRSTNQVMSFAIDSINGKLRHIATTDVVDNPVYIAPDQSNKFLLTAYFGGNKIAVYPIIGDSIIDKNSTQILDAGTNPHCILPDQTNQYVYTAVMTGGQVLQFSFDDNKGQLSALNPASIDFGANVGPRHITFHSNQKWMYIVNEIENTVYAYNKNADGTLAKFDEINTLPVSFTEYSKCADIHITPNNKYLYVSNRGHNSIAAFKVDQTDGTLSLINQYDTEPDPREFTIDPNGKYLFAGGESSGIIAAYKINEDGTLTSLKTIVAGSKITWLIAVSQIYLQTE